MLIFLQTDGEKTVEATQIQGVPLESIHGADHPAGAVSATS